MSIYQHIDGAAYKRIFVCGDLHGCFTMLQEAMWAVQFDTETDLLISVGDLIDRGNQNIECLELLDEPWFKAIRGNHEEMAIDALVSYTNEPNSKVTEHLMGHWFRNGGRWFIGLSQEEYLRAVELLNKAIDLPLIYEIDTGKQKVVVCHADYPSNIYAFDKLVDVEKLVWNRTRIINNQNGEGQIILGADLFIFGHTPIQKPIQFYNQLYIDTGAVFGNKLTLEQIK